MKRALIFKEDFKYLLKWFKNLDMAYKVMIGIVLFLLVASFYADYKRSDRIGEENNDDNLSQKGKVININNIDFKNDNKLTEDQIIKRNIKRFVRDNTDLLPIKNYFFLLNYSNMVLPEPLDSFDIRIFRQNDTISVEQSIYMNASIYQMFLKPDKKLGELDGFGLHMVLDSALQIAHLDQFISFTKWSKGKIGERIQLDMTYGYFNDIDIENIYSNDQLKTRTVKYYNDTLIPRLNYLSEYQKELKKRYIEFINN